MMVGRIVERKMTDFKTVLRKCKTSQEVDLVVYYANLDISEIPNLYLDEVEDFNKFTKKLADKRKLELQERYEKEGSAI